MLEAFAGPAAPQPSGARVRRRATRRTLILLVAGLVALGLAVPGALALLGTWETPKQFFADRSEPAYAKRVVRELLTKHKYLEISPPPKGGPILAPRVPRLVAIKHVLVAHTPNGVASGYALRFDDGIGFAVIGPGLTHTYMWAFDVPNPVLDRGCTRGWALQRVDGGTDQIGKTYGYVSGRVSSRVASLHVLYRDGSTTESAVGGGYFFAWIKPSAGWTNVTLIAENAAGHTIARLVSGGYGGIPFLPPAKPGSPIVHPVHTACAP
jgi:hypothetical protein